MSNTTEEERREGTHEVQRTLRNRLLNGSLLQRSERHLAAEMLLYLDDAASCWSACASWMLEHSYAERVDGAFARSTDRCYTPEVEERRDDVELSPVLGARFDAREEGIRIVWRSQRAVVYQNAMQDGRLSQHLRDSLATMRVHSKLAVALRDRGRDVGLLCLDSSCEEAWSATVCEQVDHLARDVIGPVLGAAIEISGEAADKAAAPSHLTHLVSFSLTPAELRVAELVLAGLSYKEIANKLDRSCSTVDHQLRSMRDKFGVNSTAKLVHAMGKQMAAPFAGRLPARATAAGVGD